MTKPTDGAMPEYPPYANMGYVLPDLNCSHVVAKADYDRLRAYALREAARMDWIDAHLCRAGQVQDSAGTLTGIMKCWQIVTQLDDSLRETVDLLRAAMERRNPGNPDVKP